MPSLVNKMLKFQMYYTQKRYHVLPKNVRNFYSFSAKNTATIDIVSSARFNKSMNNDFVKLTMNSWARMIIFIGFECFY